MDDLVVPLALAGFQIDADERFSEQVVARTVAAVEVRGRRFAWQVDEARVFVDADLRPHAGVAVVLPRIIEPGVVAELTWFRNQVERPQQLAGPHVERPRDAFRVVVRRDRHPFLERRSDQDDVFRNRRRRVQARLAALQIDLLVGVSDHADFEIDDAVLPECRNRRAGFCVQRDQSIARRHVDHTVVAFAVGPVRQTAARQLARRFHGALPFELGMHPQQLAGVGLRCEHRSPRPAGRVEDAFDDERRAFELELGTRAEIVGLESPGHFQLVEVVGGDLIER